MVPKTCSVEDCESKKYCRGYCIKHYSRWRSHGDPLKVIVQAKIPCTIETCDEKAHAHGFCAAHLYRHKKYGDPLAEGPGRGVGRKRMAQPSYAGIHKRIFYDKGKATGYACVDCGERAQEWSYDGGCPNELYVVLIKRPVAYSVDQSRYSPRCLKCHRSRDESLDRLRGADGRFMA
jgi:hypothetical protein